MAATFNYPRKDKGSRTGSNLSGEPLLADGKRELAIRAEAHERLAREQFRGWSKRFSKKHLRVISRVAGDVQAQWRQASIEAGGDSARVDELKAAARRKFDRSLAREFPDYAKWRTVRRADLREHRKLSDATLAAAGAGSHIGWGDLTATLAAGQEFVPPFTVFDVQTIDRAGFVARDDSFANPDIGHLVNNFDFDQDESTSFSDGLWGLLTIGVAANRASCGVPFTTPSPGRLQISAVLRNFYNKVMFSVHDKFGFSSAEVDIFLRLFIAVVRGTRVIFLPTMLQHTGLVSHGSDLAYSHADLDNAVPYTISATTEQRFNANETVLVLAGSEVHIQTVLDDMHCKVNAVLWWQLQKLTIGMAEDVFT